MADEHDAVHVQHLFIGGPIAGETRAILYGCKTAQHVVPTRLRVTDIADAGPRSHVPVDIFNYRQSVWRANGHNVYLMVPNDWSDHRTLTEICATYAASKYK